MSQSTQLVIQKRFEVLENICKNGRAIFFMVGQALSEIKRDKLYQLRGFDTFEKYCESMGFTRRHGNQLIIESKVVAELPEDLRKLICSERAARSLQSIPSSLRLAVATEASNGGKTPITSKTIAAVAPSSPPPRPSAPPARPGKKSSPPVESRPLDHTGIEIPKESEESWNRGHEAQEVLTYLSAIRSKLKRAQDENDKLYVEVDFTDNLAKLNQVYLDMCRAKPFAVCPICSGIESKDCLQCSGRGWVSEFYWKNIVDPSLRDLRSANESQ